MQVREIGTGLWYWTGRHPAWTAADGGPDGWAQEVGCVYYEGPDAVVLFDPLVPMEDPVRFYEALERDVERAGKPVRVLLTVDAHARSSQELAERYGVEPPPLRLRGRSCRRAWRSPPRRWASSSSGCPSTARSSPAT